MRFLFRRCSDCLNCVFSLTSRERHSRDRPECMDSAAVVFSIVEPDTTAVGSQRGCTLCGVLRAESYRKLCRRGETGGKRSVVFAAENVRWIWVVGEYDGGCASAVREISSRKKLIWLQFYPAFITLCRSCGLNVRSNCFSVLFYNEPTTFFDARV